ncbi:MAG: hypothetical protein J4F31_09005 [Flavobacteriales bacterium]|nr:hypothetical protein [Flavobacteriales bacterium]
MSDRLKVLTDKIYHEGIEKAQKESDRLLEQARQGASEIRSNAERERVALIEKTESEMENYRKKVLAEIRMSTRKTANAIKKQLHEMLVEKAIRRPAQESLRDPKVMSEILKAAAGALTRDGSGGWQLEVSDEMHRLIHSAVEAAEHNILTEGVTLQGGGEHAGGFVIREEDGAYKIVFDEATFVEFLSQFLKFETRNLLEE